MNDTVAAPADSGAVPPPSEEPTQEPVATSTSSAAHDQAVAIDDLLDLSGPSRNALRDAITQVLHCDRVAKAIKTLQKVADERGRQLARAKDLTVDALDGGQELKQSLIAAFSASQRADTSYLKWAKRFAQAGCAGRTVGDPAYDAGNAASVDATANKAAFVARWNSIAEQESLPTRTEEEI